MPIKIEQDQFDRKITKLPEEQLLSVYSDIYEIININALEKLSKKFKENKKLNKKINSKLDETTKNSTNIAEKTINMLEKSENIILKIEY